MRSSFITLCILLSILITGCSSFYTVKDADLLISQNNFDEVFNIYYFHSSKKETGVDVKIETFLKANKETAEKNITNTILSNSSSIEKVGGSAKAAGFLKSEAALPQIEKRMLQEKDERIRYRLADAVKEINNPKSKEAMLTVLEKESYPLAVISMGWYFINNPAPENGELFKAKYKEMVKKGTKADNSQARDLYVKAAAVMLKANVKQKTKQ